MKNKATLKNIQRLMFRAQLILIITLALFLGITGTLINIHFETEKRDRNLQNIAEAVASSPLLNESEPELLADYLDSLKDTLSDIDVISVVNTKNIRIYHSNHELIGTVYDGTLPDFGGGEYYAATDSGPSGTQRRAYAPIYDGSSNYCGFVMAIMLMENIWEETLQTLFIFSIITLAAVLIELIISYKMSKTIKDSLLGYEPGVISSMYRIRDNILESLDEGVIALNGNGSIEFANLAALKMLEGVSETEIKSVISSSKAQLADILIDRVPIKEDGEEVGTVGILHDRTEYTKLMEDLAGTRYLVDSMRANNHDFTNKLHVILGLIQMEMYDEAVSYIENITIVQRQTVSNIMHAIDEPAIAALLIGKTARASELNIKFVLREGCHYCASDLPLPTEMLVTVIGNLIENAFEAMNRADLKEKELLFGMYSRPGAVLITVDDTGEGIAQDDLSRIFENGFSTKGEGRGTGLYQVKAMVESQKGRITVESQKGAGTSFSVSFVNV